MLGAQRFPHGEPGFESVLKTQAMRDAASRMGRDAELRAAQAGRQLPARARGHPEWESRSCRWPSRTTTARSARPAPCAASATWAATSGAKNTLDHTYLSAAAHLGAEISVLTEVRTIEREGEGYLVTYVVHPEAHDDGERHATGQLVPVACGATACSSPRAPWVRRTCC